MKRELFQNITVIPYASGDIVDRSGFLSAVIGANAASGAAVKITVEHSDDGTAFEAVTDKRVFPETETEGGVYSFTAPVLPSAAAAASDASTTPATPTGVINVDVDLVGLKNFVKFTVTGATSLAVVLGDGAVQPV